MGTGRVDFVDMLAFTAHNTFPFGSLFCHTGFSAHHQLQSHVHSVFASGAVLSLPERV